MENRTFAVFKYRHREAGSFTAMRALKYLAIAVLVLFCVVRFFPFGMLVLVPLIIIAIRRLNAAKLYIGPRYLICGASIIYYHNLARITLEYEKGTLLLQTVSGRSLLIEQKNFPTNARKAHKVAANTAAKFFKVAEKIVAKVSATAPQVEIVTSGQGRS
ncbi:hypothetical protein SAMN05660284_01364 [Formivibrio citricus]|uniref:Uncharacterized protein n=1 Tax=Formivibrio citricus TaxID=83765 RepID=A0A1I4YL36_9NEIS|nr:hypothetical protein [Formivibrio citricus]SFN38697.1 hypothetical protein SAMN05660284_01364 [Formivibrio citricus]